jgi:hypothetical protein
LIINNTAYNESLIAAFKRGYRIGISNDPRGRYKHPDVYRLGKDGQIALKHDNKWRSYFMTDVRIDQLSMQKKIYHEDFILFMRYGYLSILKEVAKDPEREMFEAALTNPRRGHIARRLLSGLMYAVSKGYSVTPDGILLSPSGIVESLLIRPHFFNSFVKYITHPNRKIGYFAVSHLMAFQKYSFEIFNSDKWKVVARNGDLGDSSYENIILCKA